MAVEPATRPRKRGSGPTREKLLLAARQAFAELGFAATRVEDIVKQAGTSHGTFYTYFDDKRDALLALTEQSASAIYGTAVAHLASGRPRTPRDAIHARMGAFFRVFAEQWDVVRTVNQASGVHPEVEELRSRIRTSIAGSLAQLLARDRARGMVRAEVDLEVVALALVAMVEEFAARWLAAGRVLGDQEVEQLTDLWIRALYRDESPGSVD